MMVGSAISYAHGVVDPIPELGALAEETGVWLHVDGCMGGFMLHFLQRLGVVDSRLRLPRAGRLLDLDGLPQVRVRGEGRVGRAVSQPRSATPPDVRVLELDRLHGDQSHRAEHQVRRSGRGRLGDPESLRRRGLPADRAHGVGHDREAGRRDRRDPRAAGARQAADEHVLVHVGHRQRLPHRRRDEGARLVRAAPARLRLLAREPAPVDQSEQRALGRRSAGRPARVRREGARAAERRAHREDPGGLRRPRSREAHARAVPGAARDGRTSAARRCPGAWPRSTSC